MIETLQDILLRKIPMIQKDLTSSQGVDSMGASLDVITDYQFSNLDTNVIRSFMDNSVAPELSIAAHVNTTDECYHYDKVKINR